MSLHRIKRPAIFIDRDGVIIHNRAQYVRAWEDVRFYKHALDALARVGKSTYLVFIVTNQAGVGKGYITSAAVNIMNDRIVSCIHAAGGRIDGVYVCPHRDDEGCACRKPKPGMLMQAAKDHNVDLEHSYMIGDALTDIEAGQRAGVMDAFLVRTGRGKAQLREQNRNALQPFRVVTSLTQAIQAILHTESPTCVK